MMILPENLVRIAAAGGGLIIDLKKQSLMPNVLMRIAAASANSGATIVIRNPELLLPNLMIDIAIAGNGHVIFEI